MMEKREYLRKNGFPLFSSFLLWTIFFFIVVRVEIILYLKRSQKTRFSRRGDDILSKLTGNRLSDS